VTIHHIFHGVLAKTHRRQLKNDYASNGTSKTKKPDFKTIISQIGRSEDLLSQTRESLFTITRMLSFILQTSYFQAHDNKKITMIMRDITSLLDHATFLSNKINFLLDATLGMINIEQSSIIKIVSIAAVVFLPPTLVASIYGMNFQYMPELQWYIGYVSPLKVMVA
jgi:magnesium transporter